MDKLADLQDKVIGSIPYDQELIMAGLSGNAIGQCKALEEVEAIMDRLEQIVSSYKICSPGKCPSTHFLSH